MPTARRVLCALLSALVLAACQIDTTVVIDVAENGSGTVTVTTTFDADAVKRAPELQDGLRRADLAAAGWIVNDPVDHQGGVRYVATKAFRSVDELAGVLGELTGTDGVLHEVQLSREKSFGRIRWEFAAVVDASGGLGEFSDAALAAALTGRVVGRTAAEFEKELGAPPLSFVSAALELRLPVALEANTADVDANRARWVIKLTNPGPEQLQASATTTSSTPRYWAFGAAAAVAILVVVVVFTRLRDRGRTRREPVATT